MSIEIYRGWRIEKNDHGYYEAEDLKDCDVLKKLDKNLEYLKEEIMEEELTSDCCGAYTIEMDMGICPDCLEHCEFITGEDDE